MTKAASLKAAFVVSALIIITLSIRQAAISIVL